MIDIQVQDLFGNWRTISVVQNFSQTITMEMKAISSRYPDKRVRAVDENGRIVDIL